jgi:hypothetical protein
MSAWDEHYQQWGINMVEEAINALQNLSHYLLLGPLIRLCLALTSNLHNHPLAIRTTLN